jgi:RHS repeat-associated protein
VNHQGSVLFTTLKSSSGGIADQYQYGAYGEPPTSPPSSVNPFRYTGRYLDAESGLYYYRARYYSTTLGRFLQTDPIGTKDDLDLYTYVENDPLDKTDPSGTFGDGGGFSKDQWKKFVDAQKKAAERMASRADRMDKRAAKLESQGKADKAAGLRTGAANLRAGVADLQSTTKLAVGMSTDEYVAKGEGRTGPGGAAAASPDGQSVNVNLGNEKAWGADSDITIAAWSVGHESLHTGAGLTDRAVNGILSYGLSSDPAQKATFNSLRGTDRGMTKPDNLMDLAFPGFADQYEPQ